MNLRPFQIEAVKASLDFLLNNKTNSCYNACEQGLGKTVMAAQVRNILKPRVTLIICPAVVRLNWKEELEKWTIPAEDGSWPMTWTATVIESGKDLKEFIEGVKSLQWGKAIVSEIVIMSYGMVPTPAAIELFKLLKVDLLILDEAHYLKSSNAKRTKTVFKELWDKCTYKYALSGTPFTTEIVDGYTLFHRMCPTEFPDFTTFTNKYSYRRMTPWGPKFYSLKNHAELSKIIRSNFYVRYRKEEVLKDLPDKIYQTIHLGAEYSVTPKQVKKAEPDAVEKLDADYEVLMGQLRNLEKGTNEPLEITPALGKLLRLQGEAKVKPVAEYAKDLLDQNIPVVIFAHHTNVINNLVQELADFHPVVITGATHADDRQMAVKKFQARVTNLFIGQIQAAGVGITLTAASHCILAETCWSPTTLAQAVDRLHRIGQKDTVNVYTFVVKDSWDERMNQVTINRARNFKKVLDEVHA